MSVSGMSQLIVSPQNPTNDAHARLDRDLLRKPTNEQIEEVKTLFYKTHNKFHNLPNIKMHRIYKVKNGGLWKKYTAKRAKLDDNEHKLFHGTRFATVIAKNGWDLTHSKSDGLLGKGIYFANQSSKSNRYNQICTNTKVCPSSDTSLSACTCIRRTLLCRVLLGRTHKFTSNKAPTQIEKDNFSSDAFLTKFDSVTLTGDRGWYKKATGIVRNDEFAVYDTAQAYPEYVIEYRLDPTGWFYNMPKATNVNTSYWYPFSPRVNKKLDEAKNKNKPEFQILLALLYEDTRTEYRIEFANSKLKHKTSNGWEVCGTVKKI